MFEKILDLFKKDDGPSAEEYFKDEKPKPTHCQNCTHIEHCEYIPIDSSIPCDAQVKMEDFDENNKTLLIIDDNPGIISFLVDDIEFLQMEGKIPKDLNIITISGVHAAFELDTLLNRNPIKIDYAIIDITIGGAKMKDGVTHKFTGIDVYGMIKNPDLKYVFYTGNNLNPYIKSNKLMIDKYRELSGKDLTKREHVLFKTSLNVDKRQEKLVEMLFS